MLNLNFTLIKFSQYELFYILITCFYSQIFLHYIRVNVLRREGLLGLPRMDSWRSYVSISNINNDTLSIGAKLLTNKGDRQKIRRTNIKQTHRKKRKIERKSAIWQYIQYICLYKKTTFKVKIVKSKYAGKLMRMFSNSYLFYQAIFLCFRPHKTLLHGAENSECVTEWRTKEVIEDVHPYKSNVSEFTTSNEEVIFEGNM